MIERIKIYELYGVEQDARDMKDHPDFPNPRSDQGDLKALAEGILKSGARDTPIVVWKRGRDHLLLDGKRTVTAMLRFPELREALKNQLPVIWWQPRRTDGLSPEQEAFAYMIRSNSSQGETGHKLLTFREEMAAAKRLREVGLTHEKIAEILRYSHEKVRRLLCVEERLSPEVKAAVGDKITPETPLSRNAAIKLAKEKTPVDVQHQKLREAREAVLRKMEQNRPVSKVGLGRALGAARKKEAGPPPAPPVDEQHRKLMEAREQVKRELGAKAAATAPPKPVVRDDPKTNVELCEAVGSALQRALDGENLLAIVSHVKEALYWLFQLKKAFREQEARKK